jgi:GT2 family glycosyltransferase
MFVIIPAFNAPAKLARCLAHLSKQSQPPSDIFVHDNSLHNVGFTAAVNLGMRKALRSDSHTALVLNQDVYLPSDAIQKLLAFMDTHDKCAIAGVKQLWTDDPDIITHAGCRAAYPFGKHIVGRRSNADGASSEQMPWVNGAVMAIRLEAVVEFGLMDEGMFLVGSDADWCFTARLRGWEVWYCSEVEVLHDGGVSSRSPTDELQKSLDNDMLYFRDKWVGSKAFERLHGEVEIANSTIQASWQPGGLIQLNSKNDLD